MDLGILRQGAARISPSAAGTERFRKRNVSKSGRGHMAALRQPCGEIATAMLVFPEIETTPRAFFRRERDRAIRHQKDVSRRMAALPPPPLIRYETMTTLIEPDTAVAADETAHPESEIALFLDFDGTLVEIAPSPENVRLDRRVAPALATLRASLGGALALVSGRPIGFLDTVLAPHRFDIAGLHGAQIRIDGEIRSQADAPVDMRAALRDLVRFANSHVGIIVEDKRISLALHWRLAPALEGEALGLMRAVAARMGPAIRLQEGKSVAELVPAGASKGAAIAWLMASPAYAGRRPVFIGDDITDEDGFAAVNSMGGLSVRIGGDRESRAACRLASPTALRHILLDAAEGGGLTASSFMRDRP
jgi:trehalose 6-phosphate phosphatase